MLSDDMYQTITDMSLDLVDNGFQVDILQRAVIDIVIWKHKGDDWHIPYKFDKECSDFMVSINSYMTSNGYKLKEVTIVESSSPNTRFNTIRLSQRVLNMHLVEEVSITFSKV